MQLQTHINIAPSEFKINYIHQGLVLGSCFAEHISSRLSKLHFDVESNPHGILYNPVSILNTLKSHKTGQQFTSKDLVYHDGLWHSMMHHGSFSHHEPEEVLKRINSPQSSNAYNYIVITLGTTWIYDYKGETVANCHKLPSSEFTRRNLSFSQTYSALESIAVLYPTTPIIFTVSPIRHIKDGLIANSLSKSTLRTAVGELAATNENVHYFPSYEIMNDELRDYRFYAENMLQPSAQAINYIWEQFTNIYLDDASLDYAGELTKHNQLLNHRPLHTDSASYKTFHARTIAKSEELVAKYPHLRNKFSTFVDKN